MNDDEQVLADALYSAIQAESNYSARSLQARDFRVGVSDLGFCSERTRRMLDQQVPEDTDMLTAWIGTELGDGMEVAARKVWPDALIQTEVSLTLEGESGITYMLTGHPDLVDPQGRIIDFKTDYGLSTVERSGPSDQQQFQRNGYAKGAYEAGLFNVDVRLEDVEVANVWMDRAGIDKRLHCQMEPYDPAYVDHAGAWLDDVVYAYRQGEEARKEPPAQMCEVVCGFYTVCRLYDTDVEGLITDPEALTAIEMYREGLEMEKAGKSLKDQAKPHLENRAGSNGEVLLRWVHVNESLVPEQRRRAYDKIDLRKLPKPRRR